MKSLFLSAAWFNWVVALLLVFYSEVLFTFLGVSPLPTEPLFVHFFVCVIFSFGIGYYWISQDFDGNQPIVKLGALAKMILVLVGLMDCTLGLVSWQIMMLLVVDLIYSLLFYFSYLRFRPVVVC